MEIRFYSTLTLHKPLYFFYLTTAASFIRPVPKYGCKVI